VLLSAMVPISPETFGAFALTCFVIELTPGPNMAYLAILSATRGRRSGFAATVGVALGLMIVGVAAALGLAAAISSSPVLYELLRWGGITYLLWLAWDGWRDTTEPSPSQMEEVKADSAFFMRGFITNILNPKAAVFYFAVLPTFVDSARPILSQTIILSVIYVLIATGIHTAIIVLAGAARPLLEDPDRSRLVRRALSFALALIAVWFAFGTAR
jgi:threonine/homoserine/homoserine lactone efflux protein